MLAQTDIAAHALRALSGNGIREIHLLGRRGPAQAAFTNKELKELGELPDVDIVVDPVGGEVFTDSLRMLAPQGRLMVVGFAAGQVIPEVKVNRLLLNNIDVRGAAWGAFAARHPEFPQRQWRELLSLVESGVVKPPIGGVYEFDQFGRALVEMDRRRTLGKMVVRVRD